MHCYLNTAFFLESITQRGVQILKGQQSCVSALPFTFPVVVYTTDGDICDSM